METRTFKKTLRISTLTLLTCLGSIWGLFLLFGQDLLSKAYYGRSLPFLNNLINGQAQFGLDYYLLRIKTVLFLLSLALIILYLIFIILMLAILRLDLKTSLLFIFSTLISTVAMVLAAEIILNFNYAQNNWHDPNTQFDPQLGWSPIPNKRIRHNWGNISSNSLGFRSREIDPQKNQVIILGDSVAWGSGVDDNQTLSYYLEDKLQSYNCQVSNLAVSGYGIDQEYLFLKRHIGNFINLKLVVLVICAKNDLSDTGTNTSYRKRKPLYVLRDGHLMLTSTPIRKYCLRNLLSRSSLLERIANKNSALNYTLKLLAGDRDLTSEETKTVSSLLFDKIKESAESHGAKLLIVISPSEEDFPKKTAELRWFEDFFHLAQDRFAYLDYYETLKTHSQELGRIFLDVFHFTDYGNQLLAEGIFEKISSFLPFSRKAD
ncbi:MAG TPA: SGNH/GDSL hydrolase family protein [Candidatus Margulisiibacteriota bacterium]|nr:SGNH/GDSL hydrolase family protein [Candidatus Margulisiibacteriota bacterium]